MLVQLGDMKPSDKSQCFFLVQPKSCVLTSRVPMVSLKRWVRREGEAAVGAGAGSGGGKSHKHERCPRNTSQHLPLPRSPSHTTPCCPGLRPERWKFSPVCILEVNSRYIFCVSCSPFSAGISAWMKCAFSQFFTVLLWNLHSHPSAELSNSLLHLPTVSTLLWPFNQGTWLLSGRHMP